MSEHSPKYSATILFLLPATISISAIYLLHPSLPLVTALLCVGWVTYFSSQTSTGFPFAFWSLNTLAIFLTLGITYSLTRIDVEVGTFGVLMLASLVCVANNSLFSLHFKTADSDGGI